MAWPSGGRDAPAESQSGHAVEDRCSSESANAVLCALIGGEGAPADLRALGRGEEVGGDFLGV